MYTVVSRHDLDWGPPPPRPRRRTLTVCTSSDVICTSSPNFSQQAADKKKAAEKNPELRVRREVGIQTHSDTASQGASDALATLPGDTHPWQQGWARMARDPYLRTKGKASGPEEVLLNMDEESRRDPQCKDQQASLEVVAELSEY